MPVPALKAVASELLNGTSALSPASQLPYGGEPFDASIFHVEKGFWDHITCDLCTARIPAMTLCYVTRDGAYKALCVTCYAGNVVAKLGPLRAVLWHMKRLAGVHAAAYIRIERPCSSFGEPSRVPHRGRS
jgi:hypothetical protein